MIKIGKKSIGENNSVFIIAELSANHNKDYQIAKKTIKAAKLAGADAVKFQTYTPDTITIDSSNKCFLIDQGTLWDGKTLYELYQEAYMPWEWQPKLKKYAEQLGLACFSSPFDKTSVEFLTKMNVPAYKIASFEITDIPLIEYVASKNKPVIISTGIASKDEILEAVRACRRMKNSQIALLKCTSGYPASFESMNLKTIADMNKRFGAVVGLSDHTLGISVPVTAVAMGAKIIEKHLTLDRNMGGPDEAFSLEPEEFKLMVDSVRQAEKALGKVTYVLSEAVKRNRKFARSLFVVEDMTKGDNFTHINVRSIRPGNGMNPYDLKKVLKKKAKRNIKKGTPLKWSLIE
ncbi:MAG: pseudaminic acid synthase [Omnitrophica WOR_2 bacterium GWF2_38_59]|nr:MAG: pseudaminic acid synthase [Omnitrophica WOR_2 bacterium GWF2_38_59]OGX48241.1 MAG: pseudaminic acid synthase [Omnitrophica WOR_2 bacterium RIFOXYA2_FULL_38_17]OGX59594.1 MAG: pseudaminic acid synthase [Omnitrophica WOR_2 bacterium RIFOXYC2_FULL_38_12]OGX59986.1 MAG: pseudaminic acid synthase [Omnitrophica WOR_2 bacterium RIFOXYB2_FULL_38_16]